MGQLLEERTEIYKIKNMHRDYFTVNPLSCDGVQDFISSFLPSKLWGCELLPKVNVPLTNIILMGLLIFLDARNGLSHVPSVHCSFSNSHHFLGAEPAHTSLFSSWYRQQRGKDDACMGLSPQSWYISSWTGGSFEFFGPRPKTDPPPREGR